MSQFRRIARPALSICILGVFLIAAFADDKYGKSKEPVFSEVQPDHALVYFARPDFTRLIPEGTFKVFVDSAPAGWLPQRSYMAAQVDPGSRVVWGPLNATQRFDFKAGKSYLLVLVEQYGAPNRTPVAAVWESGDPAYVRAFVADKKLSYVKPNEEALAKLREEGAKKLEKEEKRAPEVHAAALPATFESVWYRPGKRGFAWKTHDATGTLTVSSEAIAYKSDKENIVIPVKDVQSVSLDRFTGFVNSGDESQWGIVRFTTAGAEEIVAFSDGHSHASTERIFLTFQSAVRSLPAASPPQQTTSAPQPTAVSSPQLTPSAPQQPDASAAPPAPAGQGLPEGFVLYDGSQEQFTIGLPKDWTAYDQGQMLKAAGMERMAGRGGDMIIFYQSKDSTSGLLLSPELMVKVDTGEIPSFFLQKQPADKGMSCTGFSEKSEKKLVDLIGKDPQFKGKNALEPAHAERTDVGGCKGLRVRAKGKSESGPPIVSDAYMASDGQKIYVFSLRNPVENFDKNEGVFQKAVSTLKLSAAK